MRQVFNVITALCMAAASLPATADVVYNWVEIEGHPLRPGPIVGRIVVKDDVWKAGSASFSFERGFELAPASSLGLSDFVISSPNFATQRLTLLPCSQLVIDPGLGTCASNGFAADELMVDGPTVEFDLQFGSVLSGFFFVDSPLDFARFTGANGDPVISIGFATNEDLTQPCSMEPHCPTRGAWVLDRTTVPVPEPPTALALLAGLVSLLRVHLRRRL